jgi:hypothetical protein
VIAKINIVLGVGINDADYHVTRNKNTKELRKNGKFKTKVVWTCPYYRKWTAMLTRCYNTKRLALFPSYVVCSVCKEWLTFSKFKIWMETQDWEGKQLDKDLLSVGNKVYGPDNCVFITGSINTFLTDNLSSRGKYLLGCHRRSHGKFRALCTDPFKTRSKVIGTYSTELEAHFAWKERKHMYACALSRLSTIESVRYALRNRYINFNVVEDGLK